MSKPLTEKVAREYGWGKLSFGVWLSRYFKSLQVEERKKEIKPLQFKTRGRIPLITEEIKKYVSEIKRRGDITYLTLNPNYIYIIEDNYKRRGRGLTYYIPIGIPFQFSPKNSNSSFMKGIYKEGNDKSHTSDGFNLNYEIIGILEFPSQTEFMNWRESPFDQK
jgi:hypothetical protein